METFIDIVFAKDENEIDLRFVEVEDAEGRSTMVGAWMIREDGYTALRIKLDQPDTRNWTTKEIIDLIEEEPELPSEMPMELFEVCRQNMNEMARVMRALVRTTKLCLIHRTTLKAISKGGDFTL